MQTKEQTPSQHSRVDGPAKVTGTATYAAEFTAEGMVHAVLVQSAIARGRLTSMDTAAAKNAPGVVAIFTPQIRPPMQPLLAASFPDNFPGERRLPLSDNEIHYAGQHIALVLAERLEQAQHAASLVRASYSEEPPVLDPSRNLAQSYRPDHFATNTKEKLQSTRGTPAEAQSEVLVDAQFETPVVTHNAMEPSATLAVAGRQAHPARQHALGAGQPKRSSRRNASA